LVVNTVLAIIGLNSLPFLGIIVGDGNVTIAVSALEVIFIMRCAKKTYLLTYLLV